MCGAGAPACAQPGVLQRRQEGLRYTKKGALAGAFLSTNFNQEVSGLIGLNLETRWYDNSCAVFRDNCRTPIAAPRPQSGTRKYLCFQSLPAKPHGGS